MIIIFSSDTFADKIFSTLHGQIAALVCEPPKPKGRGMEISENPAHLAANHAKIEVISPKELDDGFIETISKVIEQNKVDIGLIFAYGQIIPEAIIKLFPKGILNIHPSLLPKYRGATPVQSAILAGEQETGWSIIKIDSGMDSGVILAQKTVAISASDGYLSLREKILTDCLSNLSETIEAYRSGKTSPRRQKDSEATYCKKFSPVDGYLSHDLTAKQASAKTRAFQPWPKTYFEIDGRKIIVKSAHLEGELLAIDMIQPESKQSMTFAAFKNGYGSLLTKLPRYVKI